MKSLRTKFEILRRSNVLYYKIILVHNFLIFAGEPAAVPVLCGDGAGGDHG